MARIVTDYLEKSAEFFPDKAAFVDSSRTITFRQLRDEAYKIANELIRRSIFKKPIAVFLDKEVEAVEAFMGAAYSGNFYTVIDTKMPLSRIEKIISALVPEVIITDRKYHDKAVSFAGDAVVLCLEDIFSSEDADRDTVLAVTNRVIDTDILYVLFTSGSTGIPKGVIIGHRSVIDYIDWAAETFSFTSDQVFGNQAPFYFDNSVLDIYSTLKNSGTMYIIPQSCFAFPVTLLQYISTNKINTVFFVPTVLCRVADMNLLGRAGDISCLKNIIFAGEVMPARQLNIWRRALPDSVFANLYGPTEITVDCTYYILDREIADDEPVPIGFPCKNSDVLILNSEDKPAAVNERGELCVRGSSLAYGYYNNPEKTAEVFVQNPLNHSYPEKIYRTGDMVHLNGRGEIIFDGRKDFQIKHLGHRIEAGEIETAAGSLEGVEMCCCVHDSGKDMLILFYSGSALPDDIRKKLAAMLPDYMIPNANIHLESMPLNTNGKIDRLQLKNSALKGDY